MESKIIELLSIKKNNNLGVKEIAGILGEDKEEVRIIMINIYLFLIPV